MWNQFGSTGRMQDGRLILALIEDLGKSNFMLGVSQILKMVRRRQNRDFLILLRNPPGVIFELRKREGFGRLSEREKAKN